jgi:hypothetical protein
VLRSDVFWANNEVVRGRDGSPVQWITVQDSTKLWITVNYCGGQYSTVEYSTVQYSTVQYSTVKYSGI